MTIHDDELQQLIGSAVDTSHLRQFDADSIARIAQLRASRRRRLALVSVGVVAVGAAASAAVFGLASGQPTPVPGYAPQPPALRPACPVAEVTVPQVILGEAVTLKSTTVGAPATVEAVIVARPATRVLRAELIVAKPGSRAGAGDPAGLPADAALRPENQLVNGTPVVDVIPGGQKVTVTFTPTTPGSYPVFFVARYFQSDTCSGPPPPPGPIAKASGSMMQLGLIVAK